MHLRNAIFFFLQFFQAFMWKKVTSLLIVFLYESFSKLKLFIATTNVEKYLLKFIIPCSILSILNFKISPKELSKINNILNFEALEGSLYTKEKFSKT